MKTLPKDAQAGAQEEEDEFMTGLTYGGGKPDSLAGAVWTEVVKKVLGAVGDAEGKEFQAKFSQAYQAILPEYFHVNEDGKQYNLSSLLSPKALFSLLGKPANAQEAAQNAQQGGQQFLGDAETASYFSNARGFSKPIEGFKANDLLGPTEGNKTLGIRAKAKGKFMGEVTKEIEQFISSGTEKIKNIYVADQAGESSADTGRISQFGALKKKFGPLLNIIGVYIWQPEGRTRLANLHRKANDLGGRRVNNQDVANIFAKGPKTTSPEDAKKSPIIQAMSAAGYDKIYMYYPPKPLDPEKTMSADGRPIGNAICEPMGKGTGALNVDGCEDYGSVAGKIQTLKGLETRATKKAGVETKDGSIPRELDDDTLKKVAAALGKMGFNVSLSQLKTYMQNYGPAGTEAGGGYGKNPYSADMFQDKNANPTKRITIKERRLQHLRAIGAELLKDL
jgi:hypothetical protein